MPDERRYRYRGSRRFFDQVKAVEAEERARSRRFPAVTRIELGGTSAGAWYTDRRTSIDCIGCSMDKRNEFCR